MPTEMELTLEQTQQRVSYEVSISIQSGKITGLDKIRLLRAQILWGMYYNKNVDFVDLLWEDFMFQIDNRDHKKQEKMYYPRFTKTIIHHFISRDKSISMRNRIFMHIVQHDNMRDSPIYKTYLAFATGATTPKKARKFKKPTSPSKKKALVAVEEPAEKPVKKPAEKPVKKPAAKRQSTSEAQLKKTIKRSKRKTHIHQSGGSSEGADLESKVPNEPKGMSIDTRDIDDDNDDDDQQSDDERTESDDDDKVVDLNKTNDEEEEEFVHTPDDYVPIDDEDADDEEFDRINKEMYSDVNEELKDSKREDEGKDDKEMTDVGHVDAEHEEVSQEVVGDQVKDDAQTIVMAALAVQKTEVPL
ncbi:hypothetical protein Tco_0948517 [Tanacetum coccineum]